MTKRDDLTATAAPRLSPERREEIRNGRTAHSMLSRDMLLALDDIDDLTARLERLDPINLDTNALECAEATRKLALNENERLHEEILKVDAQLAAKNAEIEAIKSAAADVLDDMGLSGHTCSVLAKASLRHVLGEDRNDLTYTLEKARSVIIAVDEMHGKPSPLRSLQAQRDSAGGTISDEMVEAAEKAYLATPPEETTWAWRKKSIRAALTAAIRALPSQTVQADDRPEGCDDQSISEALNDLITLHKKGAITPIPNPVLMVMKGARNALRRRARPPAVPVDAIGVVEGLRAKWRDGPGMAPQLNACDTILESLRKASGDVK